MKPAPFPYKSDKAVPWRYTPQRPDRRKDESIVDDLSSAEVTNIFGMSDITRSGRIFAAPEPSVRAKELKGKAKTGVEESG